MRPLSGGPRTVRLAGVGLHSGLPAEVTLQAIDGPVVFRTAMGSATLAEVMPLQADLGVRIVCPSVDLDVDSVEHLLAALGGLSIQRGVAIDCTGEMPLLDGAALAFARALEELDLSSDAAGLRVLRSDEVRVGSSIYTFEPADSVELRVEIAFDAAGIGVQRAEWDGARMSFLRDVAWARTFGFRRDEAALRSAGRARGVDARSVMVLDAAGVVEPPGLPARPDEFARHKLLDLVGDLYLFGGPPLGRVCATRPGHAATHRAMAEARERTIVGTPQS